MIHCPMNEPAKHSGASRQEEFEGLLVAHQSQLFSFIFSLVQDFSDAEDVCQQTSLVLWNKFDQFEAGSSFRNWAFQAARYAAMNHVRVKSRRLPLMSAELMEELCQTEAVASDSLVESRRLALADCVQRLQPTDAGLLASYYTAERTLQQLTAELNRSAQSVCNTLRRIRRALLECVDRALAQQELP